MKIFLPFYLVLLLAGTAAIDLYMPAFAADAQTPDIVVNVTPDIPNGQAKPDGVETPAVPQINTRRLPPLPENLKPSGRHQTWGLTKTRLITAAYDLQGGTFLEYPNVNANPLGAFYFANGKWNGPVAVSADNVTLFGGTLDDAEREDLRVLQRYFFLRGQLDNPAPVAAAAPNPIPENISANPHFEEYKAVTKEYLDFQERTKALTAQRDAARGAARNKLIDELRVMQQDEAALVRKYNAVKRKYDDWKAKNPAPPTVAPPPPPPPTPLDPARAAEIRAELQQLAPEVEKILGK